jgi:butyryl-CoA dehydrogenase
MITEVFTMESAILRAEKIVARSVGGSAPISVTLARLYAAKAMDIVELAARKVIAAAAEGDMLRTQMTILRRLARHDPADTVALRREAAAHVVKMGKYAL